MRDLIVFGEDFGGLPSSTQHLIQRISKSRKVVWVNSIGLRQPKLNLRDAKRAINKLLGKTKSGFQATETTVLTNMVLVNLKTIPAPRSRLARYLAKNLMLSQLRPILNEHNIQSPILWSSLPTAADLVGHLNESSVVYYCGDDFSALAGVDHKAVCEHEKRLSNHADLIFAASETVKSKFPNEKTHLIPHGVDTELFSTPATRALDLPNNGKPTAGFYGSLSNWLDYEMLERVCQQRQDWNFVFIGPNELSSNRLPKLKNVFYLGSKPHSSLPSYSQHWDVSLLPFLPNEQIQACSPLKLMEYITARTPIVSTYFPALKPYHAYVNLVDNTHGLSQALDTALNQTKLPCNLTRTDSWDNRSSLVNELLERL